MRFPSWLIIVFMLAWLGPMMRWIFGDSRRSGKRLRPTDQQLITARLDAALAERDQVIEDFQHRISELESRLDFTERLLAERREPAALS
ncbi:MAG TPA: hypothetical protein VJK71_05945 [Gemmatimonadales bacterium]|nr:hypothetical protein [Gemmatimonadales bacterium]